MDIDKMIRYLAVFGVILLAVSLASCAESSSKEYVPNPAVSAHNPVIAEVNGRPIYRQELLDILLAGRGPSVLDELISLELARQYAAERSVMLDGAMYQAELDILLADIAPNSSPSGRMAIFRYMLAGRNITQQEYDLILKRRAILRSMAAEPIVITEAMLAEQYQLQHGRKVTVGLIATGNFRQIEMVHRQLDVGRNFAELTVQFSEDELSLANNGRLGPFSLADEQVPLPIRKAAFALTDIGQISDTFEYRDSIGKSFWAIVSLLQQSPPDGTSPEEVAESLSRQIRRHEIEKRIFDLQQSLRNKASINILDPVLRKGRQ